MSEQDYFYTCYHDAERIDEDGKSYALVDGERTNRGDT